jgi:hypothetical protein
VHTQISAFEFSALFWASSFGFRISSELERDSLLIDKWQMASASIMRRPFVGGDRPAALVLTRQAFAQRFHLFPQPRELVAQLQHRLVLLGHVALEPGDPFFERLEVWFGHASLNAGARRGVNPRDRSAAEAPAD